MIFALFLIFLNYVQREMVEQILLEPIANQAILSDNLKKVYHGKDGNPDKVAVRGLSLAIPKGQCFGMLGPNGAGKTSFISMVQKHSLLLCFFTIEVILCAPQWHIFPCR